MGDEGRRDTSQRFDQRFKRAPVTSLSDLRAKIDYVLHYEDFNDDGSKEVVRRLKRQIPDWELIRW